MDIENKTAAMLFADGILLFLYYFLDWVLRDGSMIGFEYLISVFYLLTLVVAAIESIAEGNTVRLKIAIIVMVVMHFVTHVLAGMGIAVIVALIIIIGVCVLAGPGVVAGILLGGYMTGMLGTVILIVFLFAFAFGNYIVFGA